MFEYSDFAPKVARNKLVVEVDGSVRFVLKCPQKTFRNFLSRQSMETLFSLSWGSKVAARQLTSRPGP